MASIVLPIFSSSLRAAIRTDTFLVESLSSALKMGITDHPFRKYITITTYTNAQAVRQKLRIVITEIIYIQHKKCPDNRGKNKIHKPNKRYNRHYSYILSGDIRI